ncbi:MAG TPA: tRNA pseudouridine(38-40) synthase TruA [Mycobacteriales bacterium]|nr:tRNA pseudouridine(38-40) synthase TruA [Mycobacteriales bacterium]
MRLRLDISYDGTDFAGWARQPGQRTVQGELEAALARILRADVSLTVAGRTDAGVHSTGQVAHADVAAEPDASLLRRLSGVLPPDIRVRAVSRAPEGFDARFSATYRRYVYRISDAPWGVEPVRRLDTLPWPRPLEEAAMQQAAAAFLGEHDFAAYCRRREGATTIRTVQQMDCRRDGDLIAVTVQADAFCHQMVRSLVGALLAVGDGRRTEAWPGELLDLTERANTVVVAPARGLTLVEVGYPPPGELAARAELTRRKRG